MTIISARQDDRVHLYGTAAEQPAANAQNLAPDTYYHQVDTGIVQETNGVSWTTVRSGGAAHVSQADSQGAPLIVGVNGSPYGRTLIVPEDAAVGGITWNTQNSWQDPTGCKKFSIKPLLSITDVVIIVGWSTAYASDTSVQNTILAALHAVAPDVGVPPATGSVSGLDNPNYEVLTAGDEKHEQPWDGTNRIKTICAITAITNGATAAKLMAALNVTV